MKEHNSEHDPGNGPLHRAARRPDARGDRRCARRARVQRRCRRGPDAARDAVLAHIPEGSSVMTNTSVTLQHTGIADAINDGGPYESARTKMFALDFATQAQEMKAIGGQPDYALGSV